MQGKKIFRAVDSDVANLCKQITMMQLLMGCAYVQAIRATLWGFAEHPLPTPVTAHLLQSPCPRKGGTNLEPPAAEPVPVCPGGTVEKKANDLGISGQITKLRNSIISLPYNSYIASVVPCKGIVLATKRRKTFTYTHFHKVLHCYIWNDESDTVFQVLFICTI